jgi:hypothetical protein
LADALPVVVFVVVVGWAAADMGRLSVCKNDRRPVLSIFAMLGILNSGILLIQSIDISDVEKIVTDSCSVALPHATPHPRAPCVTSSHISPPEIESPHVEQAIMGRLPDLLRSAGVLACVPEASLLIAKTPAALPQPMPVAAVQWRTLAAAFLTLGPLLVFRLWDSRPRPVENGMRIAMLPG